MKEIDWWREAVRIRFIHVLFRWNGDGVGDLDGLLSRLDYLQWLGVDAIWLSPIFQSPQVDFGHDISDYYAVDPLFGNMELLECLIESVHERG